MLGTFASVCVCSLVCRFPFVPDLIFPISCVRLRVRVCVYGSVPVCARMCVRVRVLVRLRVRVPRSLLAQSFVAVQGSGTEGIWTWCRTRHT